MAMTLADLQTFVRTHADADVEDAPNSSLEVYGRIAYRDILARLKSWPHLNATRTFTTVAGTSSYSTASLTGGDLESVFSIVDSSSIGRRLIYMTQDDADVAYGTSIATTSGTATAFSISNGNIILYPIPSDARTYTVRGNRAPVAWPNGAGSVPDLPDPLHEAIAWYMLSSYFMAQEDTQLAGAYLTEYEQMVERHMRNESTKEFSPRVMVMGGQNYRAPSFGRWVRGMLEG